MAAEVAALGETLRGEIVHFMTSIFDRLLPIASSRSQSGRSGSGRPPGKAREALPKFRPIAVQQ